MNFKKLLNLEKDRLSRNRKNKKSLITSIMSMVVLAMILANTTYAENIYKNEFITSLETVYHVYYGDEKVGIVDDEQIINEFEEKYLSSFKEKYDGIDITLSEEIVLIPEHVFNSRASNKVTIANLDKVANIAIETYEVIVGDEVIAHVSTDEKIEKLKRKLLLNYVGKEELKQYEQIENKNDIEDAKLQIGDSIIKDIQLSKTLSWKESKAHPDDVLTIDEVIQLIQKGTLEEEVYKVKKGDVLGTIAEDHDLSLKQLLQMNPHIDEDSFLQIGDELHVTVYKPLVDVVVNKISKKEESIPFTTETKEDRNMWKGDTKVIQEGKKGKKVLTYSSEYLNGQLVSTNTMDEYVIKEPVNKVVVKGTKTSPSRGTGSFTWPTVGGYISSYQGYRWGSYHKGIDIARPSNYAIKAADNGTVTSAGWENGYGYTVRINHNNGMKTVYAHMSSIHVKAGQTVGKGQQIGVMGTTGNSTGIHLHFEVYKNGQLQNPMDYLR